MYGLIIVGVQHYVESKYGEELWMKVVEKSHLGLLSFQTQRVYSDHVLKCLFCTLSDEVGESVEQLTYQSGLYFAAFTSDYGYENLLRVQGRDFISFLHNLDNLHEYLRFSYPKIRPPSFSIVKATHNCIRLKYSTKRDGYTHYVRGQLITLAKRLYDLDIRVELIDMKVVNYVYHTTYDIYALNDRHWIDPQKYYVQKPLDSWGDTIASNEFFNIFAFSLLITKEMKIRKASKSFHKLDPTLEGSGFSEKFLLSRPFIPPTLEEIKLHTHNTFELILMNDPGLKKTCEQLVSGQRACKFRGEMRYVEEWNMLLFLGAPSIRDTKQLSEHGLYICDLNMFDRSRDVIICGDQHSDELMKLFQKQHKKSEELEKSMKHLDKMRRVTDRLLYQCIPRAVARQLRDGTPAFETIQAYDVVSICFTKVFNFSAKCMHTNVNQVVELLNKMYTLFDDLTESCNVYKVETIGDSYMLVSGAPHKTRFHSAHIAEMALNILKVTNESLSWPKSTKHKSVNGSANDNDDDDDDDDHDDEDNEDEEEEKLRLFIGCHSGPIVAGIVGHKTPRYCLFGDTVNTASRMMTYGMPDRIHVSQTFASSLSEFPYILEFRGEISVKGKGKMRTYFVTGRSNDYKLPNKLFGNQSNFAEVLEQDVDQIESEHSTLSYERSVSDDDDDDDDGSNNGDCIKDDLSDDDVDDNDAAKDNISENSIGVDLDDLEHFDKSNAENRLNAFNDATLNCDVLNSRAASLIEKINHPKIPIIHKGKEYMNDNMPLDKITPTDLRTNTHTTDHRITSSSSCCSKFLTANDVSHHLSGLSVNPSSSLGWKTRDSLELDHLTKYCLQPKKTKEMCRSPTSPNHKKDVKFDLSSKEVISDNYGTSYYEYAQTTESDPVDNGDNVEEALNNKKSAAVKFQSAEQQGLVDMNSKNSVFVKQAYEGDVLKYKIERFRKMMKDESFSQVNAVTFTSSGSDLFNELTEPLSLALTELAIVRPSEPIKYLGSWLKCYTSMK
ncbi:unnamed protein product [Trichobilharzia szidati]|nr:unnamed protein product [Trichobilharzia szidati]